MDDEKLIDYVRQYEELYNLSHTDYLNGKSKNKKWATIAKELGQPVSVCKARWNNIRDNFRKSLKKRATRSGQPLRKYRYEDKLDFLLPLLKEKENKGNRGSADKITSDENDNDQSDDNDDTEEDDQDRGRISKPKYMEYMDELMKNTENSNKNNDDNMTISNLSSSSSEFIKKKRIHGTKSKCKSISAILMKYVLEMKNEKMSQQPVHPVEAFLIGLTPTLKSLSPYHLNIAKSKIFNIVQEIEMDQIMQQRSATPSSSVQPSTCRCKTELSTST